MEGIEGDLFEEFAKDHAKYGYILANLQFIWNVLRFGRPGILLRRKHMKNNTLSLWANYFLIARRHIVRTPIHSGINLLGLALGIACFFVVFFIVRLESSFDRFHSGVDDIYRIVRVSLIEGELEYRTGVSYPLAPAMEKKLSQIEAITSVLYWSWSGIQLDVLDENQDAIKKFEESNGFALVEPSYFDVLDFGDRLHWLEGSPQVLSQDKVIVLTESMAQKYFPGQDPIGKFVQIDKYWICEVKGVVTDFPPNSDFPFKILLSYETLRQNREVNMDSWTSVSSNQCYIKLRQGTDPVKFEEQVHELHALHAPKVAEFRKYKLQPLVELHHAENFSNFNNRVVAKDRLYILSIVGLFLLLVSCINYVNLTTAKAASRGKEIGLRKAIGSQRSQLLSQFLTETFLMSLVAGLLGWVLAEVGLTYFQELLGPAGDQHLIYDPVAPAVFIVIILMVTLVAGFYPSWLLSKYDPAEAIRSKSNFETGNSLARKVLVVFQFGITQGFLICTFILVQQMDLLQNVDLGFDKDLIVNMRLPVDDRQQQLLLAELKKNPHVAKASLSATVPSGTVRNTWFWDMTRPGMEEKLVFELQQVSPEYFQLFDIALLAGRGFMNQDSSNLIVLNETLCKKIGFKDPRAAIGEIVHLNNRKARVIGISADFHSKSLRHGIDKIAFIHEPRNFEVASVKLANAENLTSSLLSLQENWETVYTAHIFNYTFFDQSIANYYKNEANLSKLFKTFSFIFLCIACLGLYGLISYVVSKKSKELAVRKVFGATLSHLFGVVSKDYLPLLLVAFVLASPIAYFLMAPWLDNFTYKVQITWWMLCFPALLVVVISILTVSGQSLKAMRVNPAETLNAE